MRSMNLHVAFLAGVIQICALAVSSCGAGTAAIVSGNDGSSGSTTVQPAVAALGVENPKEPDQAKLHFTLSKEATVKLFYQRPGALPGDPPLPPQAMTQAGTNPRTFPAGASPMIAWNFALEAGLDASFHRDVRVFATIPGAQEQQTEGANALTLGLGNDAPVVEQAREPTSEVAGIVAVRLKVSDSSRDEISIRAEFDVLGDVPDLGFQLARPGGLLPLEPTPHFAFTGVVAPERGAGGTGGVELDFFWNTDVDLEDLERDARLRFTSVDPIVEGTPKETGPIHVDNNAAPIVQFDSGAVVTNPDERRGIPLPFRVFDEEEDLVDVIFQWRREGEGFPALDTDGDGELSNAEIDAILDDPVLQAEHHIATAFPRLARGLVDPVDATTVRLPELARGEGWILASGIVGRTLEILRPPSILTGPAWSTNPLNDPRAALPLGDGLTALVVDVPGNGRLREIDLATGRIVQRNGRNVIASLAPTPTAMAFERGEEAALIASESSGVWRIERVELATGLVTPLIASAEFGDRVRGIASLGTKAAVFTVGSVLLHLDYRDPIAPQIGTLLSGLATPWGVVVDPLPPDRIYVSEKGGDRVLAVELDSQGKVPVVARTRDLMPATLKGPEALALERNGSRLLVVTTLPGGAHQVVGLDLGALGGNVSFPIGPSQGDEIGSIAVGSEGLRIMPIVGANELLLGGGIEQRRTIVAYDPAASEATVDQAFVPSLRPGADWRISAENVPGKRLQRASAVGFEAFFLWNSTADVAAGRAFLRALVRDDEFGLAAAGEASKITRPSIDVEPLTLGDVQTTNDPVGIAVADLDGDGDQDLASANFFGNNLTIFFQSSPGVFGTAMERGSRGARSVAAADLDGDLDMDLVSASGVDDNLTVFRQSSPGVFVELPPLGSSATTDGALSVVAADLDDDGDQDLVSANRDGDNLTVFFQSSGVFAGSTPLGGPGTTDGAVSVAAADLDGDGDLDLVSANRDGHNLTVFIQSSRGVFVGSPPLGGIGTTTSPAFVAAADLDGDGDQDIVSGNDSNPFGRNVAVFFQFVPGMFEEPPRGIGTVPNPHSMAVADLDGDGDQDLISIGGQDGGLVALFQVSPGMFEQTALSLGDQFQPTFVTAADVDGDGDEDLVTANGSANNLKVFLSFSPGDFKGRPLVLGGRGTTDLPISTAAADLDGDGDLDLVSASLGDQFTGEVGDNLTVFRLSPGILEPTTLFLGGPGTTSDPFSVATGDLDGDGDQDIVSANAGNGGNLTVFFQTSSGMYGEAPLVLGNPSFAVAVADLDDDGDQDLVSTDVDGLNVFFQRSSGIEVTPSLVFPGRFFGTAADLDGDGDQDLLSAADGGLRVLFQESTEVFVEGPLLLAGGSSFPLSVAAADLDGDGDQDLVSNRTSLNDLTVFFQQSPGTFGGTPLTLGGPGITDNPVSVAAADMDSDGDQDIVSANQAGRNLTLFRQLPPGGFARTPLAISGFFDLFSPNSVTVADLDGDGDLDIATADGGFDSLRVFLGGR